VGPRAGLDAVSNKISASAREPNPGRPARNLVSILTEPSQLLKIIMQGYLKHVLTTKMEEGGSLAMQFCINLCF
jgi:hypothetical protein